MIIDENKIISHSWGKMMERAQGPTIYDLKSLKNIT